MPAGIGTFDFISLKGGVIPGSGEQVEEITRPNVDGVAYRKIGKRGEPFEMESLVDVLDAAAAKTLLTNYKALQGTLQNLELEDGSIYSNVIVLNIRETGRQVVTNSIGGLVANSTILVRASWTLEMTDTV